MHVRLGTYSQLARRPLDTRCQTSGAGSSRHTFIIPALCMLDLGGKLLEKLLQYRLHHAIREASDLSTDQHGSFARITPPWWLSARWLIMITDYLEETGQKYSTRHPLDLTTGRWAQGHSGFSSQASPVKRLIWKPAPLEDAIRCVLSGICWWHHDGNNCQKCWTCPDKVRHSNVPSQYLDGGPWIGAGLLLKGDRHSH